VIDHASVTLDQGGQTAPAQEPASWDVDPGDSARQAASLAEQQRPGEVKCWGPALPSTFEVFLERWARYFAADSFWSNVYSKTRRESEPDPLAHHAFCRRLAAALAQPLLEPCGGSRVKSWGPAPPSTMEEYASEWGQHVAELLTPKQPTSGAAGSREQVPAVPPPREVLPPRGDGSPSLGADILPTSTPSLADLVPAASPPALKPVDTPQAPAASLPPVAGEGVDGPLFLGAPLPSETPEPTHAVNGPPVARRGRSSAPSPSVPSRPGTTDPRNHPEPARRLLSTAEAAAHC
jgi:hypothetical protein